MLKLLLKFALVIIVLSWITHRITLGGGTGDAPSKEGLKVLVVGDSYSAGNGAGHYQGALGCYRSLNNYGGTFTAILESSLNNRKIDYTNRACSGAITEDFWNGKSGRPPMFDWVSADDDYVFLTIGGNDIYFGKIVKHCMVRAFRSWNYCDSNLNRAEELLDSGFIKGSVKTVLRGIAKRTGPNTKIVLLGYPYLEGSERTPFVLKGGPEDIEVAKRIRAIGRAGDQMQQEAVDEVNQNIGAGRITYLPVKDIFDGSASWLCDYAHTSHELYADWTNPHRWMVQPSVNASLQTTQTYYHPNPTGWRAEGIQLARQLGFNVPSRCFPS